MTNEERGADVTAENQALQNAEKAQRDEFYTHLGDIKKELNKHKEQFRDKIIFCDCDDPDESNFYKIRRGNKL